MANKLAKLSNENLENPISAIICNGIERRDNAVQVANNLQVPLVTIFHEPIPQNFNPLSFEIFISTCQSHMRCIRYGIKETKIDFNKNRHNTLLIINDFPPQEHGFLSHILQEFGGILIGNNGDLSSARPKKEWYKLMEDSKIFVNLSNRPNIPYPLLYAMDRGCSVVSNLTEGLDLFLNDGKNCLIGKSHEEIISHIKLLLNHQGLREVRIKGKETVNKEFDLNNFNDNWKSLFNEIKQKVFLR